MRPYSISITARAFLRIFSLGILLAAALPNSARAHDHDHDDHDEILRLSEAQRQRFGIVVREAGPGRLRKDVSLSGEVLFNRDSLALVSARLDGIISQLPKGVGDRVEAGEVLAVLDSRELADAKARFLAAEARAVLAAKTVERENVLREKNVSSEQERLDAVQNDAEARIELRAARQRLLALGLAEEALASLAEEPADGMTRHEVRAPISGIVVERNVALGESVGEGGQMFMVVNLDTVWVDLTVHLRDLAEVSAGTKVQVKADHSAAVAEGEIVMLTPYVDPGLRAATARVVLDNAEGRWPPGAFVTGRVLADGGELPVVVPRDAVQTLDGESVIFVEHDGGFEPRHVIIGATDRDAAGIVAGLEPGTRYVAQGAFHLKASIVTSSLDAHAGHGH